MAIMTIPARCFVKLRRCYEKNNEKIILFFISIILNSNLADKALFIRFAFTGYRPLVTG